MTRGTWKRLENQARLTLKVGSAATPLRSIVLPVSGSMLDIPNRGPFHTHRFAAHFCPRMTGQAPCSLDCDTIRNKRRLNITVRIWDDYGMVMVRLSSDGNKGGSLKTRAELSQSGCHILHSDRALNHIRQQENETMVKRTSI